MQESFLIGHTVNCFIWQLSGKIKSLGGKIGIEEVLFQNWLYQSEIRDVQDFLLTGAKTMRARSNKGNVTVDTGSKELQFKIAVTIILQEKIFPWKALN